MHITIYKCNKQVCIRKDKIALLDTTLYQTITSALSFKWQTQNAPDTTCTCTCTVSESSK